MDSRMNTRLKRLILWAGACICIGLLYSYLYSNFGIRIPCAFHTITGYYCPGCGISRMCIAILHMDILKAFSYNIGVMMALPIMIVIGLQIMIQYLKAGNITLTKRQNIVVWILVVYLIIFGIVRNLPMMDFLRP